MVGGLESRCLGRVCGADIAARQHSDDGRMYWKYVELSVH